jgi:hypothetical protein
MAGGARRDCAACQAAKVGTNTSGADGSAAERFVRPDRVVVTPPALDDYPRLAHSVADFTIEQFIADALTRPWLFWTLRKRSLRLDQEIGRGPEIRQAMSSIMNDSGRPAIQSQLLIPP